MTEMDKNPIGELMQNTMESVKNMLKVDTVVGDPIVTPDGITLVPISRISVGFGGGGSRSLYHGQDLRSGQRLTLRAGAGLLTPVSRKGL